MIPRARVRKSIGNSPFFQSQFSLIIRIRQAAHNGYNDLSEQAMLLGGG
jgi:hypothetical protein